MEKISQRTVLMMTPSAWPDKGGVETHLRAVSQELSDLGWRILVLVPPKKRPAGKLGLFWLWGWMFMQLPLFAAVSVIHIHDVFLWFWPIWPIVKLGWLLTGKNGKIITTFHGWEGDFPPTAWQKFNKWLAQKGSDVTVAVGAFLNQFYPITATKVIYGGVRRLPVGEKSSVGQKKTAQRVVYVGRLAADTGLPLLLQAAKDEDVRKKQVTFEFWGEGDLRSRCAAVGDAKGWVEDPAIWLQQQSNIAWVVASGYLSVLEALAAGQRVIVVADNPLKQVYYATVPFKNYLQIVSSTTELVALLQQDPATLISATQLAKQSAEIAKNYGWGKVAQLYLDCYVG